jgi:hypothetical protein
LARTWFLTGLMGPGGGRTSDGKKKGGKSEDGGSEKDGEVGWCRLTLCRLPKTKRLETKFCKLLSTSAFKFNLRRYSKGSAWKSEMGVKTDVRRCRFTLSTPR